jgi:hypothetical protein
MNTQLPKHRLLPSLLLGAAVVGSWSGLALAQDTPEESSEVELHHELAGQDDAESTELPRARQLQLVLEATPGMDDWRARLGDLDVDARERAFDEVVAEAANDLRLRLALQAWSEDLAQPELAWSSRLALRELERNSRPPILAWLRVDGGWAHIHHAHSPEVESPGVPGSGPDPSVQLRTFEGGGEHVLLDDPPGVSSLYMPRQFLIPRQAVVTRRYHLEVQPERVMLFEAILSEGTWKQRTFAAASLDDLLAQHPNLRQQVPGLSAYLAKPASSSTSFRWNSERPMLRFGAIVDAVRGLAGSGAPEAERVQPQLSTLILGVKCTQISSEESQGRLLGPGVGLRIEARKPGSVAEDLGLQRGDILVEVAEQMLCDSDAITRALRERGSESIEVVFIDRAGIERRRVWNPVDSAPLKTQDDETDQAPRGPR